MWTLVAFFNDGSFRALIGAQDTVADANSYRTYEPIVDSLSWDDTFSHYAVIPWDMSQR